MENHHKSAIEEFTAIFLKESRKKTEYLTIYKNLLRKEKQQGSLKGYGSLEE